MIKDIDFVECPICGHRGQRLVRHIKGKHDMSFEDFKTNYPNCETTCKVVRDRIKSKTKESVNTTSCREKRKNWYTSEEGKTVLSKNGAKAWLDEDFVIRHNKAVSESSKKMWSDSSFRSKQSELIKVSLNTDRVRKLHHDRLVKMWENPEYRLKMTLNAANMVIDGKLGKSISCSVGGVNYVFKSIWEMEFAKVLNTLGISFLYEEIKFKYFFDDIVRVYVPDFYLVDYNAFIEVKPKCFQSEEINVIKLNSVRDKGYQIFYVGDGEYNNIDYIKSLINRL